MVRRGADEEHLYFRYSLLGVLRLKSYKIETKEFDECVGFVR